LKKNTKIPHASKEPPKEKKGKKKSKLNVSEEEEEEKPKKTKNEKEKVEVKPSKSSALLPAAKAEKLPLEKGGKKKHMSNGGKYVWWW